MQGPPDEATVAWLEQLPLGFAFVDIGGSTIWLNRAAHEIVGDEGFIDAETLARALAGARATSEVDFGDRAVEVSASLIRTDGVGDAQYIFCTYRDITEARRSERALHESRERYRHIIENASEII